MRIKKLIVVEVGNEEEGKAKIILRRPTNRDFSLFSGLSDEEFSQTQYLKILKELIVDWEGIEDENGRPADFSKDAVEDLPLEIGLEVFRKLNDSIGRTFRGIEGMGGAGTGSSSTENA